MREVPSFLRHWKMLLMIRPVLVMWVFHCLLIKYHRLSIKCPRLTVDRPTITSMPQTLNQTSDYSGMDSAVAESGVVRSFRRQESGRAKPARVRACYIFGDPDRLQSACPFRRNCHRCLQPRHVARACLVPRPVRGESTFVTAGGGQVINLATKVHGPIMVSAVVS